MRKNGKEYYYIYSSENGHELCYARSRKPDRGFGFGGTIISNGDIFETEDGFSRQLNYTGTNHGSLVELNGKWYVFYHRQTNQNFFTRQGCAEQVYFDEQGDIHQVSMTSCGLNDGPLPAKGVYDGYIACNLMSSEGAVPYSLRGNVSDIHPYITQYSDDSISYQYIANLREGACAGYKYFGFDGTESNVSLTYRSRTGGSVAVSTSLHGNEIGRIEMTPSGEWNEALSEIRVSSSVHAIYFTFHGEKADFKSFEIYFREQRAKWLLADIWRLPRGSNTPPLGAFQI